MKCHFLVKWNEKTSNFISILAYWLLASRILQSALAFTEGMVTHSYFRSFTLLVSVLFDFFLSYPVEWGRQSCTLLPHLMDFGGEGKGGSKATDKRREQSLGTWVRLFSASIFLGNKLSTWVETISHSGVLGELSLNGVCT